MTFGPNAAHRFVKISQHFPPQKTRRPPTPRGESTRRPGINIQIDLTPSSRSPSHNSSLLWWEHCRGAQVAIQLFNEYDNYFSHMPRLCTNTCSGVQHQAAMEPSPRCPHAVIVDVLFIRRFTLFTFPSTFFALIFHCFSGGGEEGGGGDSSRQLLGEPLLPTRFLRHPPTPTLIPFA